MPRCALPLAASPSFAKLGILTVGIWLSACVAPALQMNPASNLVNVRGIVFDSLTRTRLSGARITFTAADSAGGTAATATTDANGTFAISLRSGT